MYVSNIVRNMAGECETWAVIINKAIKWRWSGVFIGNFEQIQHNLK